ncbi:hypothetical protein QL285_010563 [Trifolium repens]|nr:hypothetical protein QL285_010563 [Trifolium repens]
MAYIFNVSSIFLRYLILFVIIVFTLLMQLSPASADMKMRKLGNMSSPPPPPQHHLPQSPSGGDPPHPGGHG